MKKDNKSVDAKNNEILKYYNDNFEDNNKKKNQPRVEVMQEFFPNGKFKKGK